jgi:hypothetical protein
MNKEYRKQLICEIAERHRKEDELVKELSCPQKITIDRECDAMNESLDILVRRGINPDQIRSEENYNSII